MTKATMIAEIQSMITEMRPMIKHAGMKRDLLQISVETPSFMMVFIRPGHKWLKSILENEHTVAQRIRSQIPESQWEGYQKLSGLDTEDLTEVVAMNSALAKLRKAISSKDRPDFFKRSAQREQVKRRKA